MALTVIGWPGTRLGPALAAELGCTGGTLGLHRFPDGETLVRIDAPVEGNDVVFAASLDGPDAKILPLLFASDAASELGAMRVVLAAPYLAYMRQDIRFHAGEAVSSRTFAELLSDRFDALVTVDPHLHRWEALANIYRIPSRAIAAAPAIAQWIAAHVNAPLVVGPDAESEQWVAEVARLAGAPYAVMDKTRNGDRNVSVRLRDAPRPEGRTPVLVDDIVSTGRTLCAAAAALREAGYGRPIAVGVHALFGDDALHAMRQAGIARIVTCDTVDHETNAITLVPAIAQAVRETMDA